jgi:hypothetical protein
MSSILYYSNFCPHSKELIGKLAKTKTKEELHYACIDNREKKGGRIYIILGNGQRLILPPHVLKVPALFIMKEEGRVLYGNEIFEYFRPKEEYETQQSTQNNGEPLAFSTVEMSGLSDNYAYLDLTPDELSAKGDGGLKQMHHFSLLNQKDSIQTPPEDYAPDKIGQVDMGKLEMQRAQDIKLK